VQRNVDIKLNEEQQKLLNEINFDLDEIIEKRSGQQNGDLVCSLIKQLVEGNAIPRIRIEYFVDPEYNIGGRNKSRKNNFEKNGTSGDEIFKHPHFLKHFEYFVFGPDLPDSILSSFKSKVESCGSITSGDVSILKTFVNMIARESHLGRDSVGEFYKLSIECGLPSCYASMISEGVPKARR